MITLVARSVLFFSQGDEENFFRSLKDISFVSEIYGRGTDLYVDCKDCPISGDDFLTLYAVFKRYHVDCKQISILANLLENDDVSYVMSSEMLWHYDIFG